MQRIMRFFVIIIVVLLSTSTVQAAERKYIVPFSDNPNIYASYYPDVVASPCGDVYTVYQDHEGMDYIMPVGTPIYAAADGVVTHRVQTCTRWLCYGNYMYIDHGSNNWTVYAHLSSYVAGDGQTVKQGDLIAYSGTSGTDTPHLHWEVVTGTSAIGGEPHNPYYCDNEWFTTSPPTFAGRVIPPQAQSAIESKADELWGIRPFGGTQCQHGLICEEPPDGNMHWYGGPTAQHKSLIVEDWYMGVWGWLALTYDPATNHINRAYVLRHAFWDAYRNRGGPDVFGAPLGDEMDRSLSYYTPYDPYCGTNKDGCITAFCGPTNQFTSVQRFEHSTFCWHPATQQVCLSSPNDSGWENIPYCCELSAQATYPCEAVMGINYSACVPEVHDSLDNDCDGLTDEAFDLDLDGFSADQGDCDERYNGVHPGATEYYDGLDNDCDDIIDNVTWYEDQYLFFDADGNGDDDPCVRRFTHDVVCLCDGQTLYWSAPGPVQGTGEYLLWRNDRTTYYDYLGADGIPDLVVTFGDGNSASEYLYWHTTIAVRYGNQLQLDRNLDGILNTYFTYGAGDQEAAYYLADLNGDGYPDPIVRRGNLYLADTDGNQAADWSFTYGWSTDDVYFADLNGDGIDGIIVRRGALLLVNESLQFGTPNHPQSNIATYSFPWGVGR